MEKCTLYRLILHTNDGFESFDDYEEVKKITVLLADLKNFDETSEIITHFTPDSLGDFLNLSAETALLDWFKYFQLFINTWILAEHDRAARYWVTCATALDIKITIDFIEFGEKAKIPKCIMKLSACLKQLQHQQFSPNVYKTLNKHFPNCLSKQNGSKSFWVKFESNHEPNLEFSQTEPSWLDDGVNLSKTLETAPLEWMNDIIICFAFFAKLSPDFKIVLKKPVHDNDTQVIFYVKNGNLPDFAIFLGTFNNFLKRKKDKTSVAVLKCALGLVPFVGSSLTLKQAADAFKTGNHKTGTCYLLLGTAGFVADAFLVAGPAASLVAKAAKSSPGVLKACAAIANVTSKADIVTKCTQTLANAAGRVVNENASNGISVPGGRVEMSDEVLLKKVFPRLARDILGNSEGECEFTQKGQDLWHLTV